jgi:hypothetical protein
MKIPCYGLRALVLAFLFFPLSCIQMESRILVKPDGSGTVEERFLMRKEFVHAMQEMGKAAEAAGEKKDEPSPTSLYDEEKLKAKAAEMGEGVTFVAGRKIELEKYEGYTVTYAFKDINTLRINQNPHENTAGVSGEVSQLPAKEYMTFDFKPGHPCLLTLKSPQKEAPTPTEERPSGSEEEPVAEEMPPEVKELFEGMRMAMLLEIQGSIVETNATHVDGTRITLMELDFGKLLEDPKALKVLIEAQKKSLESAKEVIKDLPGIKVDLNKEVLVKFQ